MYEVFTYAKVAKDAANFSTVAAYKLVVYKKDTNLCTCVLTISVYHRRLLRNPSFVNIHLAKCNILSCDIKVI